MREELGTQVRIPRKTVSNYVKYLLKNTFEGWYVLVAVWGDTMPMKKTDNSPLHGP